MKTYGLYVETSRHPSIGEGKIERTEHLYATSNISIDDLRRRWNMRAMKRDSQVGEYFYPRFDLSRKDDLQLYYDDSQGGKYLLCCSYSVSIREIIQHI